MRSLRNALLSLLVLTTALSPVLGCVFRDYARVTTRLESWPANPGDRQGARIFAARVEGKGRGDPGYLAMFSPLRLFQPFDAEALWRVAPDRIDETHQGQACVEVDDLSTDTSRLLGFYTLCGKYLAVSALGAGMLYYVSWNGAGGQTLFVPGQTEAGLRATVIAGVLTFLVLQGSDFVPLDQRAIAPLGVLYFATGVSLLARAAAFQLMALQLHQIGALPLAATLEERIAYELGVGLFLLLSAYAYLNGPTIEWTRARGAVVACMLQLALVHSLLPALPDERTERRAAKKVDKSFAQAGKALAGIEAQRQKQAIKKALKAARFAGEASDRVLPFRLALSF